MIQGCGATAPYLYPFLALFLVDQRKAFLCSFVKFVDVFSPFLPTFHSDLFSGKPFWNEFMVRALPRVSSSERSISGIISGGSAEGFFRVRS
jgi:hypothetical protein